MNLSVWVFLCSSCICIFIFIAVSKLVPIIIVALRVPSQYVAMIASVLNALLRMGQRAYPLRESMDRNICLTLL